MINALYFVNVYSYRMTNLSAYIRLRIKYCFRIDRIFLFYVHNEHLKFKVPNTYVFNLCYMCPWGIIVQGEVASDTGLLFWKLYLYL